MKYALVIPAFFIGAVAGWIFLGVLPGIVITEILWGAESFRHPELFASMARPTMVIGGLMAAAAAVIALRRERG